MRTWATLDDNVETVTARTLPLMAARWIVAATSAVLVGVAIGVATAIAWLIAVAVAEAWTWQATKAQRHGRAASRLERRRYIASIVFMNIVWCSLSIALWAQADGAFLVAALCLIAAQLLHAQTFTAHSPAMLSIVGGAPAATLVGLVSFGGSFALPQRVLMFGAAAVMLVYSAAAARVNYRREMRLAAARDAEIEANRSKGLYLSVISHEIRTPLNGVLGLAQSLAASGLSVNQARQADVLVQSGIAMVRMLNDVLDMAKFEAGELPVERKVLHIGNIVRSLEGLWAPQFAERSLTFDCIAAGDVPDTLIGDEGRILQVLNNLIANAMKFTQTGGVRVEISGDQALIGFCVVDTGAGIAPDDVQKLFQPFVQAPSSDGAKATGTGLGLFISRQFARSMGGDIDLVSVPGQGTRATLTLQRSVATETVSPGENAIHAKGLSVLVIDDHPVNRLVATTMLEKFDCKVVTAGTAKAGLDLANSLAFDLVLLDLNLPDLDGRQVAEQLRETKAMVVAMTAESSADRLAALPSFGFADVLPKPILAQSLAIILARCGSRIPGL